MARILVIDDDPDMRAMVGQTLKSAGHKVILAADGREGVARYRTSPADLAIIDLYMPNQEGLETLREFHTRFPEVAIVAMSGWPTAATMLSIAQKLGAIGVLHKPFFIKELIAVVAQALGGQSQARRCPRCGSHMVLRRAKTGQHVGRKVWGCSTFAKTKCGGMREVD